MEDPNARKLVDKTELEFTSDLRKEEYHALKEELFFLIEERNNLVELTDKGRMSISSNNNEFVIPDIILPDEYSLLEMGEKEQDHPMKWDEIRSISYRKWDDPVSPDLQSIAANSQSGLSA